MKCCEVVWCGVRAGLISYPFSTRELVAISRHLQAYPQDALMKAVANVVAFDRHGRLPLAARCASPPPKM